MDVNEKRKELLKQRRQEISEEYKRRREKENKPLVLDTEEVTISIENLQAHLQALSREITIEKLNRKVEEYKSFFTRLSADQDILFALIDDYKKRKGPSAPKTSQPVESIIKSRLQHKESGPLPGNNTELDLISKVSRHTYEHFQKTVTQTNLTEQECVELSLRLFVEYCEKNITKEEKTELPKSKIFRQF